MNEQIPFDRYKRKGGRLERVPHYVRANPKRVNRLRRLVLTSHMQRGQASIASLEEQIKDAADEAKVAMQAAVKRWQDFCGKIAGKLARYTARRGR